MGWDYKTPQDPSWACTECQSSFVSFPWRRHLPPGPAPGPQSALLAHLDRLLGSAYARLREEEGGDAAAMDELDG